MIEKNPDRDELVKAFGKAVRVLRNRLGVSQDELAWRAAMHRTYVTNVERGVGNPSLESISRLANALGTSISALIAAAEGNGNAHAKSRKSVDILLVEDNAADTELTLAALQRAGLTNSVHVVNDGVEALNYVFRTGRYKGAHGANQPRLILLDLHLPKIGGLEVLQRVKTDKSSASIPVVVLTASQKDRDVAESQRLGADAYIIKPVNFHSLSQVTPKLNLCWLLLQGSSRGFVVESRQKST